MNTKNVLACLTAVPLLLTLASPSIADTSSSDVAEANFSASSLLDGYEIQALVLAESSRADDQPAGTAIALLGEFHEVSMHWWARAEDWRQAPNGFMTDEGVEMNRQFRKAFDSIPSLAEVLEAAGVDTAITSALRFYPVEAMTDWLCLVREGCYPKGAMIGTAFIDQSVAEELCVVARNEGLRCDLALVP